MVPKTRESPIQYSLAKREPIAMLAYLTPQLHLLLMREERNFHCMNEWHQVLMPRFRQLIQEQPKN
jgi:hypothetical protein